jgi:hypothetical protein
LIEFGHLAFYKPLGAVWGSSPLLGEAEAMAVLKPITTPRLTRRNIDSWPVAGSGLSARVVNCLEREGVKTIGQLRGWREKDLLALEHFGVISSENIRWFFNWTRRLEAGNGQLANFRTCLREFLNRQEVHVLEQRYGLTDSQFRPQMKRRTLAEIANEMGGGLTRERVRQVEEVAIQSLQAKLPATVFEAQEVYWVNRIQASSCVVTSNELRDWTEDPMLGGYQPWGALLLLTETYSRITFRYDYFTTLPPQTLSQVEKQILQVLHSVREPVPFEHVLAEVSDDLDFLNGQRPRLVTTILDHHPEISGTVDRRYFLPRVGASVVLTDILRADPEPLHFHELTRRYNQRMLPHSQRGTGYILRVLNLMQNAQRVSRALYQLKSR